MWIVTQLLLRIDLLIIILVVFSVHFHGIQLKKYCCCFCFGKNMGSASDKSTEKGSAYESPKLDLPDASDSEKVSEVYNV